MIEILVGACVLLVIVAVVFAYQHVEVIKDLCCIIFYLVFYASISWLIGFIIMQIWFGG